MMFEPTCRPETPYNPADRLFPIVRCMSCYCEAVGANEDYRGDTAIAAWNRRASPPSPAPAESGAVAWMYQSQYDGRVELFPNNALWREHGYAQRHPDAVPLYTSDELTALTAKVALLTEALKPFGTLGQYLLDQGFTSKPDHAGMYGFDRIDLTYGDFRQAARALSEPDKEGT